MIKNHGRKFRHKRSLRRHIAKRIMFWDSVIKSESDKKTRELCIGYRNYWERKLGELR